jgi:dCMP deaminase
MKPKFLDLYFDIAERISKLSYARRLKVGAVIVKDHRILSYGYNGTPAGFDNNCEIEIPEQLYDGNVVSPKQLITKPEVIHAEMNALMKLIQHGDSAAGASIFLTHSPCIECAKAILQSGINEVYFCDVYRSDQGVDLLLRSGLNVIKKSDLAPSEASHSPPPSLSPGSAQTPVKAL